MIGEAPSFWGSQYFVMKPKFRLTEDAPEEMKKEFEEFFVDWDLGQSEHPEMETPTYIWNGTIVDKARTDAVDAFRLRRQRRLDAKKAEEGRWITTENGHKIHLSEEGEPDKGNPKVIEAMKAWGSTKSQKEGPTVNGVGLREVLNECTGGGYSKASQRGANANDDREQYRFFGRYMHGVGYRSESHDAFNAYVYYGDSLINGKLRGSKPRDMSQQKEWLENEERTKEYIDQMTKAIDENPLRESACVFRGIKKGSTFAKMLGLDLPNGTSVESLFENDDFLESLVGRTFSDPGFVSTSIDPEVPSKVGFDRLCSMEIYCPEGTKGTYFGDALRLTDEYEYLLQRGTQFVVTEVGVEEKPYGGGKRLKMKVAVLSQEPQEIPETKKLYEPNKRIVESLEKEEAIPTDELKRMYNGLSDGALEDIVNARNGPKGDAFEAVDDVLVEEAHAGNITPMQAGELEAYAMRIMDVGSRIDPHVSYHKEELSGGNPKYIPSQETISDVRNEHPDFPDELIERIATMRTIAKEHEERAQREKELYPEHTIIPQKILEAAQSYKAREQYAIRAYLTSRERQGNG